MICITLSSWSSSIHQCVCYWYLVFVFAAIPLLEIASVVVVFYPSACLLLVSRWHSFLLLFLCWGLLVLSTCCRCRYIYILSLVESHHYFFYVVTHCCLSGFLSIWCLDQTLLSSQTWKRISIDIKVWTQQLRHGSLNWEVTTLKFELRSYDIEVWTEKLRHRSLNSEVTTW